MALKTFNLDAEVYDEFSKHCKSNGLSMSKKVENFIKKELEMIKKEGDVSGNPKLEIEKELKKMDPQQMEHSFQKYC